MMSKLVNTPIGIRYARTCKEWDERSRPYLVDSGEQLIAEIPQFVSHPGEYDRQANAIANLLVTSVNAMQKKASEPKPSGEWFRDFSNVVKLAKHLESIGWFDSPSHVIQFFEKPWAYENEWNTMMWPLPDGP